MSPIRSLVAAAAAATVLTALTPASPLTSTARAATPSCPDGLVAGSVVSPAGGHPFVMCSGRIRSFDGTPIDTDVTIPVHGSGPHPLMIMLHGWGNSKTEWESTTLAGTAPASYHWNNAWFASQGYVVLTYSARGFHRSCGQDSSGYSYASDPMCRDTAGEASWTHLADRRWEIHDAQYLAGLLVDAGLAAPHRIAVTGGSYGGGQSWDLALSQNKIVSATSTDPNHPVLTPWRSPGGTAMSLTAALPMYPWTDLADALVQNGRASDAAPGAPADGSHEQPYGVDKQSYVDGLYALGSSTAQYAAPGADPTADLTNWYAGINAGEPYSTNPNASQALTQVGGAFRSPYAMPVPTGTHEVPVFVIQGDTDPLFDGLQALDMVNRLRAVDPAWPVTVFLGDVGHSYANNPLDVWRQAHNEANAWLAAVMRHSTPTAAPVTVTTTACLAGQTHATYTAATYESIATSTVHLDSAAAQTTVSSNAATHEGTATDPIANNGCRTMAASQSDPNQAVYTFAVPTGTLVGAPVVNVDTTVTGTSAEIAARLWEIDPSGNQTLITRTVYRIEDTTSPTSAHLAFELWPQAWQFIAGDTLKLELTQDDQPVWRPDNLASSISYTNLDLALPITGV